jgi:hypothetical protein
MQFPSKFQWHSSQRFKINPKVNLEEQKTMNSKGHTEQKSNARGITITYSKLFYNAIVIKKKPWY